MTALMLQGTGSNVGKSLLVAGICRALKNRGVTPLPFKPQNMSNNAAVTVDGGEIGRAQAFQALACGAAPINDMNPVLLKPEAERRTQVILCGRHKMTVAANEYGSVKQQLLPSVLESFERLKSACDIVVVEGAGSPAEVNLRKGDIANMGFAEAARVPVILVGDIDRGGVIAQMIGTKAVLDLNDERLIKAFLINKFRGDVRLFDGGYDLIREKTGWSGLGVLPWFAQANALPAEDALDLSFRKTGGKLKIACLRLSRIANFDDLDPLSMEEEIDLRMVRAGEFIPAETDLVIIPGTKSTISDLQFLRDQGWDIDIHAHVRRGGHVLGLCGGYQMLGKTISDPEGIEGQSGCYEGLGLLNTDTVMTQDKSLTLKSAIHVQSGAEVKGYEIHIGRTDGPDRARPYMIDGELGEGAVSESGKVAGTYFHGIFSSDGFRKAFLESFGATGSGIIYNQKVEETLDLLADHIEEHLDVDAMIKIANSSI
ncbi:MAG: cobyric acid synthase [Methyloligellaceae bacterium]